MLRQEQQLVYRIDCDKYSTTDGIPLTLVLQKESPKPIFLILLGTKTHLSTTPVIKDIRRKKGQGYILKDERKPSYSLSGPSPSALPYLFSNCDPYQYKPMQHQQYPTNPSQGTSSFGRPSYDLSYKNQAMLWGQQLQHNFNDRPFFGGRNRAQPSFKPPVLQSQPFALPNEDNMGINFNRMGSTTETSLLPYYNQRNKRRARVMMPIEQNNSVPYSPWNLYDQQANHIMQPNPAHQTPTVPPPPSGIPNDERAKTTNQIGILCCFA